MNVRCLRIVIDASRVMLQIVVSLTGNSGGIICNLLALHFVFINQLNRIRIKDISTQIRQLIGHLLNHSMQAWRQLMLLPVCTQRKQWVETNQSNFRIYLTDIRISQLMVLR